VEWKKLWAMRSRTAGSYNVPIKDKSTNKSLSESVKNMSHFVVKVSAICLGFSANHYQVVQECRKLLKAEMSSRWV
jgi:site-specific DNA-adenine methylase